MKLLFYPTHPTATKPLTPSHVKALVWFDLLVKATNRVAELTTLANRVTCDVTAQNLGFWHYLDTRFGSEAGFYADKDELWVAEQYLRYHAERFESPPAALDELRTRVEGEFWMHPASRRVLEAWAGQCELLGLDRQALQTWERLPLAVDEVVDVLESLDLAVDARSMGGGVYLDLTPEGVPLRQVVSEHGIPNYVVHVLRELLAVGPEYDRVLLGFDAELRDDFQLIVRVLERRGIGVVTLPLERVKLPGVTGTTRSGGWQSYTLQRIAERLVPTYGVAAFRLGVRMYFVLHIGRRGGSPFDLDMLERFTRKAAGAVRALDGEEPDRRASEALLRELWPELVTRDELAPDPNRLLQAVLKRAPQSAAARALVRELAL